MLAKTAKTASKIDVARGLDEITEIINNVDKMLQNRNVRVTVRLPVGTVIPSLSSTVFFGYGRSRADENKFCLKAYIPFENGYTAYDLSAMSRDVKFAVIDKSILAAVVNEVHKAILSELVILEEKKDTAFKELDAAVAALFSDKRIDACLLENTGSPKTK